MTPTSFSAATNMSGASSSRAATSRTRLSDMPSEMKASISTDTEKRTANRPIASAPRNRATRIAMTSPAPFAKSPTRNSAPALRRMPRATPTEAGVMSAEPRTAPASIGLAIAEDLHGRLEKDLEVERRSPLPEVIEVVLDACLHVFEPGCLAAAAVDLGEARDARQHLVADHVSLDEPAVLLVVRHRMRPGADEAHAAAKDVEELRQLVDRI